jgi:ABC-2 type transport system ATP-binding protein
MHLRGGPVVIEARDVEKTFRIPHERVDSLKERITHPRLARGFRELNALQGVSFEVHKGEFFGIVGRNGSGKSTLLKILASIYRADAGRVRMAGRLAPFIELGVGFNPEMTSRDNVILNGVLMGLSRAEATRRLDSVLDFAELREFTDLKLKNYSSGMMVRLAFAVMVEADADIMLIDEVLAVGDAAFAQKCVDIFRARRDAGRTIVLVTHDMATVQSFCDRAMLLHDGELRYSGDPEEAALRYYRLNFGQEQSGRRNGDIPEVIVKLIDVWLEDPSGRRIENVEQDVPLQIGMVVEARRELRNPTFGFHFLTTDGNTVFGFNVKLGDEDDDDTDHVVATGQRVRITAHSENPLMPGRYTVTSMISRNRSLGDIALHLLRALEFVVYGTNSGPGVVNVKTDASAVIE